MVKQRSKWIDTFPRIDGYKRMKICVNCKQRFEAKSMAKIYCQNCDKYGK